MKNAEWKRFFSFTVEWHGNQGNTYLANKIRKELDVILLDFAIKYDGVGQISKITKVRSGGY